MWGNLSGWIIAVLLIIGAVCGAAYLDHRDRVTAPTSFALDPKNFGSVDLSIELQEMMPELFGPADASAALRTAVDA